MSKTDWSGNLFKGGVNGSDTHAKFLSAINSASTLGLFENGDDCGEGSIGGGVEKSNSLLEKDGEKGGTFAGCTPPPVRLDLRPATNCWRDAGRAAGNWVCIFN
jgi:hypothetical protein